MPTRAPTMNDDASSYAQEWRAATRQDIREVGEQVKEIATRQEQFTTETARQQQQTAIILERVEGHLSQHDQAIAAIRAQPAHVRDWLSSGVSWLGVLMTAIGTGCGCFGVVSVGATAITAVATIIYLIAFFKP